jgi:CubicO group peptidase (beta-lactamase class C family)/D-alanyl-D-alanine dipeptidase
MQLSFPQTSFISIALLLGATIRLPAQASVGPAKGYEGAVKILDAFIQKQVADKRLPGLSIALVDDQRVVWAKGFGFADPGKKKPATAETVYRVGSVSKLFTDLAVMQLVERGALDLDEPVKKYLEDSFKPANKFDKEITLRHLMSHRSGLVRESPVGNYFDPDEPSLEKTIRSLNGIDLVYEPGKKVKYSNAGIAAIGLAIEKTQKEKFSRYLGRTLLAPLGMKRSSFEPDPDVVKHLAKANMWTYHGREFLAPTFELGMAPAGCMYSTVLDLSRFLEFLFAKGKSADGDALVKPATLDAMYKPQFAKKDDKQKFGLGFAISEFEGRRRLGHGGAIYGFATDLSALPEDKLGVVVIASLDGANAVVTRISSEALRLMLAVKAKKALPAIQESAPLKDGEAAKLAGRYKAGKDSFELRDSGGRLLFWPGQGGFLYEMRKQGDDLIADDRLAYGMKLTPKEGKLILDGKTFEQIKETKPAPMPANWAGLIGEYGWDHNTLYILEKDGQLYALIEWFFLYPLKEIDKNTYEFPDHGLYHGEKLIFSRDKKGQATEVAAASVVFARRKLDGEDGSTFKIKPLKPVADLRKEALKATPPVEKGDFRKPDLVDLNKLDPTIKLDIRYASKDNFLSTPFYTSAKAFMQRPAAEALVRVHKKLADQGLGIMVFDAYRPWAVTKMFWDATPEDKRIFVANPAIGSRHNRGCAVDLTLFDRKTGKPIPMVGGFDEMSDRSYPDYLGGTSLQRYYRDLLRKAMAAEGFTVYEAEWWHFDFKDWKKYGILNKTFEEIAAPREEK